MFFLETICKVILCASFPFFLFPRLFNEVAYLLYEPMFDILNGLELNIYKPWDFIHL